MSDTPADVHEASCVRVGGVVGCSCGVIQRRMWADYWRKLAESQTDLPPEEARLLNVNRWELYE